MDDHTHDGQYRVVDDIIYYKNQIYSVPESKLKQKILKEVHDSPVVGHPGFLKTYRILQKRFLWKVLKGDVLQYVRECTVCQQNKFEHTLLARLLQPLQIPEHKWESISMDFITGLPKVNRKDFIFMVVDRLTKYAHSFTIPSDLQAAQVANLFFREVFHLHGLPRNIVSDWDRRFINIFWTKIFWMIGTELTKYKLPPIDRRTNKDCEQVARRLPLELRFSTIENV